MPGRDQSVGCVGGGRDEKAAGGEHPQWIEIERARNRLGLRQDRHGLAFHRRAAIGGERELTDTGRQTALGGIVQRGHPSGVEDGHRLRDDGDAGIGQEARSAFDDCGIEDTPHPVGELAGEQGGSFDRYRLRQQKHVPRAGAARAQECAACAPRRAGRR